MYHTKTSTMRVNFKSPYENVIKIALKFNINLIFLNEKNFYLHE